MSADVHNDRHTFINQLKVNPLAQAELGKHISDILTDSTRRSDLYAIHKGTDKQHQVYPELTQDDLLNC